MIDCGSCCFADGQEHNTVSLGGARPPRAPQTRHEGEALSKQEIFGNQTLSVMFGDETWWCWTEWPNGIKHVWSNSSGTSEASRIYGLSERANTELMRAQNMFDKRCLNEQNIPNQKREKKKCLTAFDRIFELMAFKFYQTQTTGTIKQQQITGA